MNEGFHTSQTLQEYLMFITKTKKSLKIGSKNIEMLLSKKTKCMHGLVQGIS